MPNIGKNILRVAIKRWINPLSNLKLSAVSQSDDRSSEWLLFVEHFGDNLPWHSFVLILNLIFCGAEILYKVGS